MIEASSTGVYYLRIQPPPKTSFSPISHSYRKRLISWNRLYWTNLSVTSALWLPSIISHPQLSSKDAELEYANHYQFGKVREMTTWFQTHVLQSFPIRLILDQVLLYLKILIGDLNCFFILCRNHLLAIYYQWISEDRHQHQLQTLLLHRQLWTF